MTGTKQKKEKSMFLSKALLLMYIGEADKKKIEVDHNRLKNDLQTICLELFKKEILVPVDFKPFGNDVYSEQLDEDVLWHHSIGLIMIKRGSIIYEITPAGKEEIKNREDSVYFTMPESVFEQMKKSIGEVLDR